MVVLHGFASSNYYNIVKHVLLHKNIPFEKHFIYTGSQELLSISPVGKVPALTTHNGENLCETTVICDYLEEAYPQQPLYPQEPLARARVRQIMKVAELYLELPSRRLIAYAFSGSPAPEAVKADVRHVTKRGIKALNELCQFAPFIAGDEMTLADIYVFYVNSLVHSIGSSQLGWDILAEIQGVKEWTRSMRDTDIARTIEADRLENEPDFRAYITSYIAGNKAPAKT